MRNTFQIKNIQCVIFSHKFSLNREIKTSFKNISYLFKIRNECARFFVFQVYRENDRMQVGSANLTILGTSSAAMTSR